MKKNSFKKIVLYVLMAIVSVSAYFAQNGNIASAIEILVIKIDTTYLTEAVVSDHPVVLQAKVLNSKIQYVYGKEIIYQIVSGADCAEIRNGNNLYVLKAGQFSLKASLADNPSVFQTINCNTHELSFSNVRILSKIENVTVYTQPIFLTGTLEVNGIAFPEDIHKAMKYEVVSGNAEIFSNTYLRITGEGKVVLKASSIYDDEAFVLKEIDVSDSDKTLIVDGEEILKQGSLSGGSSCSSSAGQVSILILLISLAAFAVLSQKKSL